MKTSNIIITAYCIFLIGATLTLFIDYKQHKGVGEMTLQQVIELPDFSVVVAESGAKFQISQSDSNKLCIFALENKKIPTSLYRIQNDTLFVASVQINKLIPSFHVRNIKHITAGKESDITIFGITSDLLNIKTWGGRLRFHGSSKTGESAIRNTNNITIEAHNKASVNANDLALDNLEITADDSEVIISECVINTLKTNLQNNSKLRSYGQTATKSYITKDHTSNFGFH